MLIQFVKSSAYMYLTKPYFTPQMSYAIIMMLLRFKIIFQEDLHMATISRGIKAPIIREGDDIVSIVCDCVLSASKEQGFTLRDRDVVAVTEAVVARVQNYIESRLGKSKESESADSGAILDRAEKAFRLAMQRAGLA